jgi:maleate isomerase
MYGWRAKIGLILPASDTTMEPELYRMAPEGVSIHTTRIELPQFTRESLLKMEKQIERAVRELLQAEVSLITFGCTSGSFVGGAGYESHLHKKIALLSSKPVVVTSEAVIEALRSLGLKKLAVVTPYPEEINKLEKIFFEENGFTITRIGGYDFSRKIEGYPLKSSTLTAIGLQEPYVAYVLGKMLDSPDADGIFISCTCFRTLEIIQMLEEDLKKPVVTSNKATMVAILKSVGIRSGLKGYGKLFNQI